MSSTLKIDATKGFVALPASVMDFEMSLGAFRVLVELCNLACIRGYSWPGQDQLAEKMGRSKASISAYVKELRDLGLIETISQKMASGYNYRCKYLVTFWASWIQTRKENQIKNNKPANSNQPAESSVRPAERPSSKKNKIYKTQTSEIAKRLAGDVNDAYEAWKEIIDPRSNKLRKEPPPGLASFSKNLLSKFPNQPNISLGEIEDGLQGIWKTLGLSVSADTLNLQSALLSRHNCSQAALINIRAEIKAAWQPHWKKPPTSDQFNQFISKHIANKPTLDRLSFISCALLSHENSEKRLPRAA
ncbi:helix-turn-helix domain-containing protein [Falsihalocynthiibacter arcticus]|uniref:Helix-turn-helix domain-containing protein n=1 Tax=Falsihalocynthiibacter arcticus TaxID=1579316 RepID=A0A126V6A4_9RHOB|nr:helix-turn-helix domain-containing protein [Falsihalocynthiibacter arcticus]AML53810.1 hypothetical protein RC74_21395 [Falsihalocynthiibacter arcticus]